MDLNPKAGEMRVLSQAMIARRRASLRPSHFADLLSGICRSLEFCADQGTSRRRIPAALSLFFELETGCVDDFLPAHEFSVEERGGFFRSHADWFDTECS